MTDRTRRVSLSVAAALVSAGGAAMLSVPAGLDQTSANGTRVFAVLASLGLVLLLTLPGVVLREFTGRRVLWLAVAALGIGAGAGAFWLSSSAARTCTAHYDGRAVIVGTEWTELGQRYVASNPGLSNDDVLFDAAGDANRVWTSASIDRCRSRMAVTYFLWLPFFAAGLTALLQTVPSGTLPVSPRSRSTAASPSPATETMVRYDVFISYRHGGRDMLFARELLAALERAGYAVAIDERDFPANASFLLEMERCIRESRFTVAILSPRYLESGHTEEEAILTKVLDMNDRKRRLIPMVIEPVHMPAWLFGIVGIDCTKSDPLVDPFDKLRATLGAPLAETVPAPRT